MQTLVSRASILSGSLLLLSVGSSGPAAQVLQPSRGALGFKLNGGLAQQPGTSDVLGFVLSPDGTRVVFSDDHLVDNRSDLFSRPTDGSSAAVLLSDPLLSSAHTYTVAPVSGRVVYRQGDALRSVPGDGSASAVRLNEGLPVGHQVVAYWISPDGQFVILWAQLPAAGPFQGQTRALYRVPTDGSAPPVALTGYLAMDGAWASPDLSTLVYSVLLDTLVMNLYQVPTDGSSAPAFVVQSDITSGDEYSGFSFDELTFSDDGTRIVFEQYTGVYGDEPHRYDLRTAALDGSATPAYLTQPSETNLRNYVFDGDHRVVYIASGVVAVSLDGSQRVPLFAVGAQEKDLLALSDDGTRVAFVIDLAGSQDALYQAPVDGSQVAVQLASGAISSVRFAGTTVVCSYRSALTNRYLHWAVPLAGGASVALNPPPFDNAGADIAIHPGGQDVLYRAERDGLGVLDLYRAPLDGSTPPRRLNTTLVAGGDVSSFATAGTGDFVVYHADAKANESFELFGAPFAGGTVVHYNVPASSGPVLGDVSSMTVSSDGQCVVYRADQILDERFGLYANRPFAEGPPFSLTSGFADDYNVFPEVALSPDGTRVAFVLAQGNSDSGDLYASDTTQQGAPILLDNSSIPATTIRISSTGTWVVYRRKPSLSGPLVLVSKRLDGVGNRHDLSPTTGTVGDFSLAPNGNFVVFMGPLAQPGVIELFRAPLDGAAPMTKLNQPLVSGRNVTAFAISPDSARVVYIANAEQGHIHELYSVPADGSAVPIKLNDSLLPSGTVSDFLITSDSAFVVYRADKGLPNRLFRVPITGGAPIQVTPISNGFGVQAGYRLSADGQTVYLRATHAAPPRIELFRVASDGSGSPVALSGTLVSGGNVQAFALAPDESHLAYTADQRTDEVIELFSATPTPGTDVLLHAMPANGDVSTIRIAPDSLDVVYGADPLDGVLELFSAALVGGSAPSRLNRPLPTGGDVEGDFVPLSGGGAIYRADQEEDGVLELFFGLHGLRLRTGKLK